MNTISTYFRQLQSSNMFSVYLSIFRIFIGLHIIKKILFKWSSLSLFFDGYFYESDFSGSLLGFFAPGFVSFLVENYQYTMLGICTLALLLVFGIGKQLTTILTFTGICIYQNMMGLSLNGGDNLMFFGLLYLCFTRCFDHFCLFKNQKPLEGSTSELSKTLLLFSNLACYSIMVHLSLVYLVSALHKIHADVWFNGVAIYYILNVDRYSGPLSEFISNSGVLVTLGTYFTLAFELLFPILIWYKKHRLWLLISGVFLHLGIYVTMMIFDFEIYFVAIYGFFISNAFWLMAKDRIGERLDSVFGKRKVAENLVSGV